MNSGNVIHVINASGRGYTIFKQAMSDFPSDRFSDQVIANMNPPAWIIGHLTVVCDVAGTMVGMESVVPVGYGEKYGPRSTPTLDGGDYPSKDEMMKLYDDVRGAVLSKLATVDAAVLGQENPLERMREELPTVGDMVAFLLTTHEGVHYGQLLAMRRAFGLGMMF